MPFLKHTAFIGSLLICAGLQFSAALQSIGVALIFLHPFLNGQAKHVIPSLKKNIPALLLISYYLLIFISILYTDNFKIFWEQNALQKLPFLLLPIGLSTGGNFTARKKYVLLYFFTIAVWVISIATFINYILNFNEINAQIIHSKPIPIITGISHIYFSAMLAFAVCISAYFSFVEKPVSMIQKWFIKSIFFTLLICIHTISARTGLLAFYASVFIYLVIHIWRSKKMLQGIALLGSAIIILILSILFVPSLNNRLANTRTDIDRMQTGKDINHYSISMRVEALRTAWKVYLKSPIIGVGPADIISEMEAQYAADNSPLTAENRKMPHNQFLQTLTMLGILGLAVLLSFFLYPLFWRKHFSGMPYMALYLLFLLILFFSFQVESMLERQIGLTFFCLFYLFLPMKANSQIGSKPINS